jgi:PadR family transcriptional regulator PadR
MTDDDALPVPTDWLTQVRRGLLELCVLTLVATEPRYGYDLLTVLGRWPQLAVTEGTLYPLLRRLEREGSVTTTWRESAAGPPRKYYQLTPAGSQRQAALAREWAALTQAVAALAHEHDQGHGQQAQ